MKDAIKEQVASLPDSPGIYKFLDDQNTVIYIGKAKSLKKRVSSYFNKQSQYNRKTEKLASEIANIDYTITSSEFDALLLENNFIKENQPKYNILLKDDKTFPYICILNERFPRIIYTRKFIRKQGEYFGPYSSVVSMKNVLDLIRQLYSIRTCNYNLSEENIQLGKFKVCLEYHIGNCKGPCEGLQNESDYATDIQHARNILKGQLSVVINYFKDQMKEAANSLLFERAEMYKNKLALLEKFQTKSTVVNRSLSDIDVITITSNKNSAYLNFLRIKEGAITFSENIEVKKKMDEADAEIISYVAHEMRSKHGDENETILSNIQIETRSDTLINVVPQKGDKGKLVALSLKNALYQKHKKEEERNHQKQKINELLPQLQKDLRLTTIPMVIECFDNSNFQGSFPVASMVRFVNAKPDKKGYRHFNIKSVTGPNDFASMKEIVHRRYKRLVDENQQLPDLIVVDGGKGQLSSACEALKEISLYGTIAIVGIAKKLEEIYYPEDSLPLHINKKSGGLLLLQRIRDEAHRFAITFHRQKRGKASLQTQLEAIPGIGKQSADKLLSHFKSWKKVQSAEFEQISAIVGEAKARLIWEANKKGNQT